MSRVMVSNVAAGSQVVRPPYPPHQVEALLARLKSRDLQVYRNALHREMSIAGGAAASLNWKVFDPTSPLEVSDAPTRGFVTNRPVYQWIEDLIEETRVELQRRTSELAALESRILVVPDRDFLAVEEQFAEATKKVQLTLDSLTHILAYQVIVTRVMPYDEREEAKEEVRRLLDERSELLKTVAVKDKKEKERSQEALKVDAKAAGLFSRAMEVREDRFRAWPGRHGYVVLRGPTIRSSSTKLKSTNTTNMTSGTKKLSGQSDSDLKKGGGDTQHAILRKLRRVPR